MTTALVTPEVEIDKIDVVPDFNARKKMDREQLKELARTIEDTGLVQPIKVRQKEGGRFDLVAGHRRLEAAKLAGRKKIGITLSTGSPQAEALVENIHRVDLNPIETAHGLKALADEHNLDTNKKIAAKAGKSEDWVGEHLRLLRLPKSVQRYIAAGQVPMDAEPLLRPIAEISPKVAAAVCEVGKEEELSGRRFVERFGELFERAASADFKNMPPMIRVPRFTLSEVIPDLDPKREEHKDLVARITEAFFHHPFEMDDPRMELVETEIDAARAAGVLVEHSEGHFTRAFIIDRAFAADLVDRAIERRRKEKEEKSRIEGERKQKRKDEAKKARDERKASGEESPQAKARVEAELARRFNDDLGRQLLKRRSGGKSKKHSLARAKAVAHLVVEDNPGLAGRGLRFTLESLRDVQISPLKKGGQKVKIAYATDQECLEALLRRIDQARTETEVLEVLTEALLAAILADSKAEPLSRRPRWFGPTPALEKILRTEIKEVRPRRPRKPGKASA